MCGVEKTLAKVVVVFNVKPQNTVPEVIAFPRYNMKYSGENVILRGIFNVFHYFSCYIANILIAFLTVH